MLNNTHRILNNTNSSRMKITNNYGTIVFIQQILTFIFNTFLIIFMAMSKKIRKCISCQLFLNLPATHVLASIMHLVTFYHQYYQLFMLCNALLLQTFFSLMLTSLDRYIAVRYPYKYENITRKEVFIISASSWFLTTIFYGLTLKIKVTLVTLITLVTILILLSSIILIITNVSIYTIAQKHVRAILKCMVGQERKRANTRKSAYVCFALVSTFVLFWSPDVIHSIWYLSGGQERNKNIDNNLFSYVIAVIYHCNAMFDPIIYALFKKELKDELQERFFGKSHSNEMKLKSYAQCNDNIPSIQTHL